MNEYLPFVTAIVTLATAVIAWRVKVAVHSVHLDINSRMDRLLKKEGESERAAGVVEGTEQERQRTKRGKQ